jgi:membrane protein YdbS with pleckstrin-like domain
MPTMSSDTPDPVTNAPAAEERPHRPADDREEVYFEGSPLLRGEIGRMLITIVIGVILFAIPILAWLMKWNWPWWLSVALVVIGIIVIVTPIVMMKAIRYRISNYRIDLEHGILSKEIDTLELWHVEDIHFHQSLLDRIFGVGTITVISHDDTTPKLALKGVPNPRPLFETLKQRVIAVKRQRGVIKMDVGN